MTYMDPKTSVEYATHYTTASHIKILTYTCVNHILATCLLLAQFIKYAFFVI